MKKSTSALAVATLVVIAILAYSIFMKQIDSEFNLMATVLGVVTFLFGVFLAFSLSDRHQRIDKIRENDSIERSQLITIYFSSKIFGKKYQQKILDLIEEYLMATLDFQIWDYVMTEPYYQKLFTLMADAPVRSTKAESFYSYFIELGNNLGIARRQTIGIIEDRLSRFEWLVFIALSVVLIGTMIFINTGSIASILTILVLSVAVLTLLKFLHSLDALTWKENIRIFEPYEKTFESLGLMRYYPDSVISVKGIKPKKPYRLVTYPHPYPDHSDKHIEIIN